MAYLPFIGYLAVLLLLTWFVHGRGPALYWALPFALVVAAADEFVATRPATAAHVYAARFRLTKVAALITVCIGLLIAVVNVVRQSLNPSSADVLSALLQGVMAGVVVRTLLTAYFNRSLRSSPTSIQRFLLLLVIGILICLVPTELSKLHLAGMFVSGIGIGSYLHYHVRGNEHHHARHNRLLQNIVTVLQETDEEFCPRELDAMRAFADQKWRKLDRLFANLQITSTVLELVHASRLRLKGRYDEALGILRREIDRPERNANLENLLYLQKGLNHGEKGQTQDMFDALALSESLNANCVLTKVTLALRKAEQVPIQEAAGVRVDLLTLQKEALQRIEEALILYENRPSQCLLSLMTGSTVPFTWTFLQDAYAYVLSKTGRHRFAKPLLNQCINEDPTFSSPYLHLAEWHLIDILRKDAGRVRDPQSSLATATMLLEIAVALEAGRDSLVARRAKRLRDIAKAMGFGPRGSAPEKGVGLDSMNGSKPIAVVSTATSRHAILEKEGGGVHGETLNPANLRDFKPQDSPTCGREDFTVYSSSLARAMGPRDT